MHTISVYTFALAAYVLGVEQRCIFPMRDVAIRIMRCERQDVAMSHCIEKHEHLCGADTEKSMA